MPSFKKKRFPMVQKFKRLDHQHLLYSVPNRVLKIVIHDYQIEVTTYSLYYVFSYYGLVLRIILFNKNGMKCAMVEYDSVEGKKLFQEVLTKVVILSHDPTAATRARDYLNDFRMFYTCNKLKIEYSWTHQLTVLRNDETRSWDFTRQSFSDQAPSLYNTNVNDYYQQPNIEFNVYRVNVSSQQPQIILSPVPLYNSEANVVIVDGLLMDTTNTDKLFNLFSIYGNVNKIQFLKDRPGVVLVQMFDQISADNCVRFLNNAPIGLHGLISVMWAPTACFPTDYCSFSMPDSSPNYKDYSESKNQRFLLPRPQYWIQPLSRVLRFYNMPANVHADYIYEIFATKNVLPMNVRVLPPDEDTRLSRGLVEFASIGLAVLAIMKCNNREIKSTTSTHYLKLCFSSSQSIDLKH